MGAGTQIYFAAGGAENTESFFAAVGQKTAVRIQESKRHKFY